MNFKKQINDTKIFALGGLGEVGKNMYCIMTQSEIIITDAGITFPSDDMPGIDYIIPDFTFLKKNENKIKALFITHGHEDHIGAIPYLLKQINVPIYATKLTIGLIEHKLEEHKLLRSTKMKVVNPGQTITLGSMKVEFIRITHSIPDACALAIHTPVGTVVHTGDFKIDYTPIDGEIVDFEDFQKKRCGFDKVMIPSGDYEKDLAEIWDYYKNVKAKFPENFNLDEQYR